MNRTAARFALHQLVHWGAVGVMVPVMTLVLREVGLSLLEVGFALAAYSLTTVVLEVPSGALSDLWGRRRTYTLGVFADLTAVVLMLFAPTIGVVVLATALRGAGRAFVSGSLDALAIESIRRETPDYDLQLLFSRVGMAIPAGLAATSLLGGFLPELTGVPILAGLAAWSPSGAFSVNLLVHGALVASAGLLAWLLFEETPRTATAGSAHDSDAHSVGLPAVVRQVATSISFGLRTSGLSLLLFSSVALGLVLLSVETFWQPRLNQLVTSDNVRIFGVLGSGYFAMAVLGNGLSPLVVKVLGGNRAAAIIVYRALSAAALAILAAQLTSAGFAFAYLGFFFLFTASTPAQAAMLNELVPDDRRSTLISVDSLMLQTGGFAGSLLFGFVSQRFGIGTSWTIAAAVMGLSAILFVPLLRSEASRAACSSLRSKR